jgi:hypothetical protein
MDQQQAGMIVVSASDLQQERLKAKEEIETLWVILAAICYASGGHLSVSHWDLHAISFGDLLEFKDNADNRRMEVRLIKKKQT